MRYIALIDGEDGAFGVIIPDAPGCTAMGDTIDEAIANAVEALSDWVQAGEIDGSPAPKARTPEALLSDPEVREFMTSATTLAQVPLVRGEGLPVKANLSLDRGVLRAIDAAAKERGLTRSAMVERLARAGMAHV